MLELYGVQVESMLVAVSFGEIVATGKDLKELEINLLKECRKNARHTQASCGGHGKAHDNGLAVERYDERLRKLGVEPENDPGEGVFNGVGAR